jgi:hypothetical protein
MSAIFKNPCKKCLVKACCELICEKRDSHIKTIDYLFDVVPNIIVFSATAILILMIIIKFLTEGVKLLIR